MEDAQATELLFPCKVVTPIGLIPEIEPCARNSIVPDAEGKRLKFPESWISPEKAVDLMVGTEMESEVSNGFALDSAILIQGWIFADLDEGL